MALMSTSTKIWCQYYSLHSYVNFPSLLNTIHARLLHQICKPLSLYVTVASSLKCLVGFNTQSSDAMRGLYSFKIIHNMSHAHTPRLGTIFRLYKYLFYEGIEPVAKRNRLTTVITVSLFSSTSRHSWLSLISRSEYSLIFSIDLITI